MHEELTTAVRDRFWLLRRGSAIAHCCQSWFVIELRSPTDAIEKLREKMREYLANDCRLGWLIDPQTQQVEIYRPNQEVEVLLSPSTLSGEGVLPEFVLNLQPIMFLD